MGQLTEKERELVAIGAAVGSNCIPCIAYHVRQSLKLGIDEGQIREAIEVSENVKKLPAQLVRTTAYAQLEDTTEQIAETGCYDDSEGTDSQSCCG